MKSIRYIFQLRIEILFLDGENKAYNWRSTQYYVSFMENGTSMNQIAKQLNVYHKHVKNVIQKSKQTKAMPKKWGRPRKSSLCQDRLIAREVKKDPFLTAPWLKELLSNENSLNISTSTVRRRLCDVQLSGRLAKRKPHVSKQSIKKRLAFAKRHTDKDDRWCNNVLWSDESKFNRFSSGGKSVRKMAIKPGKQS